MSYVSPPIVEAVFSVQFSELVPEAELRRLARAFLGAYPKHEEQIEVDLKINTGSLDTAPRFTGSRLTSGGGDKILLLTDREFASIQLAPYQGWEVFFELGWRNYMKYRREIGVRKIARVALRYVNRIDVPGRIENITDFALVRHPLEADSRPIRFQYFNVIETGFGLANVNVASIDSPLLGHSAILVDIDAFVIGDISLREDDLQNNFFKLREVKNRVFESLIGEKAREMFRSAKP